MRTYGLIPLIKPLGSASEAKLALLPGGPHCSASGPREITKASFAGNCVSALVLQLVGCGLMEEKSEPKQTEGLTISIEPKLW
jgi:hypothetical protein